jgi:ribonucleotide reductase alpha subunit
MLVTKRDNRTEPVQFDKITNRIKKLIKSNESNILDPILVAQKVVASLYSGITTEELDIESASICMNLTTLNPLYSYLGARILVSNLHKKTLNDFSSKIEKLYNTTNNINKKLYEYVMANKDIINNMINYNNDYYYDFFGFKTLEKAYLLKVNKQIIERPQDMLMRVAITLQKGNLDLIKKTYNMMAEGYYTHASPTLFNSMTNTMQLSSCFLLNTKDDLNEIAKTWNSCAQISKWAGGIGLSVTNIRGKNSLIKGTGGQSNGLVPFLKVFDNIARWIDQGGKRPGSIAIYLEPSHPDIYEFLDLRKNFGADTDRARDLFLALWIPDLFMKQVDKDGSWYLMSSDECPDLDKVYGDEYEKLYYKYVNENKYRKEIKARDLWIAIIQSQIETGMPYISFKDNVNKRSNQKNLGVIRNSNLCVHGDTQILTSNGYKVIKTLENIEVEVWNGFEWSKVTVKKTGTNKDLIRVNLSNGAYLDCTPEHKFYILINNKSVEIQAKDLYLDATLIKYNLPDAIELKNPEKIKNAYTHGFLFGDAANNNLTSNDNITLNKRSLSNETPSFTILNNASINDKLRWLEGYYDANGIIGENGYIEIHQINKEILINIRLMLHTLGIESTISLLKDNFKLLISPLLFDIGFKPKKLILEGKQNSLNFEKQFVKVISVEPSFKNVDTYCFTEPLKHLGMFNGILTGQCNEIVQYSDEKEYAVCNLASIALKQFIKPFENKHKFIVYTLMNCKYCNYVKKYLTANKLQFEEINYSEESSIKLKILLGKDNLMYPQIFNNDNHIGGWHELFNFIKCTFDFEKLYKVAHLATINLDKVIDINYYPVYEAKLSNQKHRPIGLGIQGLADALVMMKIPFESNEALEFNKMVMETIYLASLTASNELAKTRLKQMKQFMDLYSEQNEKLDEFYDENKVLSSQQLNELYHILRPNKYEIERNLKLENKNLMGSYSSFEGSLFSEGKFQFDMYDNNQFECNNHYADKWDKLRKDIIKYGTRNSMLTALMPTASTSQILANNECFEFFTNNIYTRKTQAGDFMLVNKYLVNELIGIGLWNTQLKDKIIANDGSVQTLDIPLEIKNLYKTIWEIKQIWVLKAARARQPYVDQTQSMNIFMAEPDNQRLSSCHFWGWKNGLKTGMYYLRTKPSTGAIKITVDPTLNKNIQNTNNNGCESCSA